MRQFLNFVRKEFIHIFRDPLTLLLLLGMPVVEMVIFGYALNMEVSGIRTLVVDDARDNLSRDIIAALDANPYFILQGATSDRSQMSALLRSDRTDLVLLLPKDLEKDVLTRGKKAQISVITDATDANIGQIRFNYVRGLIGQVMLSHLPPSGSSSSGGAFDIEQNTRMLYNPSLRSSYNFVPGVMGLVLIIICTLMTSVSIAREKERGTMEVLLASPVRPTTMVVAKTIPYFLVSFINLLSILFIAYFLLGVPIRGALWLIFLVTFVYIFLALAIGMVISAVAATQRDAIMMSGFGMMMPTMVFSGMIFPIDNMPVILQWITKVVPANYFISAIRKLMIQGAGLGAVTTELLVLFLMAALILTLAILRIRPRLN